MSKEKPICVECAYCCQRPGTETRPYQPKESTPQACVVYLCRATEEIDQKQMPRDPVTGEQQSVGLVRCDGRNADFQCQLFKIQ